MVVWVNLGSWPGWIPPERTHLGSLRRGIFFALIFAARFNPPFRPPGCLPCLICQRHLLAGAPKTSAAGQAVEPCLDFRGFPHHLAELASRQLDRPREGAGLHHFP